MQQNKSDFIRRYFHNDIENGILGIGIICFSDAPTDFFLAPQPFYSCSILLSGSLVAQTTNHLSGNNMKKNILTPGSVIQFFPSDGTTTAPAQPSFVPASDVETSLFHICLSAKTYDALAAAGLLVPDAIFSIRFESHLEGWMPALMEQLRNISQENLAEAYLDIQKFLIHLHRPLLNATTTNSQIVESAKQLLFDSCLHDISFPDIAVSLGLGYENFRKIFKEETGKSPLQYVLEARFHYAERFLTEGMSVKETAAAVGYADPYVFSKQFKKYIGKSPNCYKRK